MTTSTALTRRWFHSTVEDTLHRQVHAWSRVPGRGRTQAMCAYGRRRGPPPDALPRGALSMPARRLLVVTYYHPPDPTGGHRWAAMGHWLRSLGHEVTTITTNAWGALEDDLATDTHRTGDLMASPFLRRMLRRPPLASGTDSQAAVAKPPLSVIPRVVVPDVGLVTWLPAALTAARRLMREHQIDCVVTTGPMHSTHLLGPMLGRKRPAWIADFRDGWCYEPLRPPWPTNVQARLDATMERRVVRGADAVIGVSRPIAEDFSARLGTAATYIPNGWDPRWDARIPQATEVELEPNTVSVVHTGALGGEVWRDPEPVFAAMRWIAARRPDAAQRLRLVLAGPLDTRLRELLERTEGAGVRHLGQLPRGAALALQRRAQALLLVTSPHRTSATPGKLYEYLAAGKPIIALAGESETSQIIQGTGTGVVVPPDDVEGIARSLLAAADGTLASAYAPSGRDQYVYPAPAEAVAELVERVIEWRN
jgi:glycosyltransferase involved in cell wall biosynthesis